MTRKHDAVKRALDAFWSSLAESYPEATTGDLDPLTVEAFESAADAVAQFWIETNVAPEGATEPPGPVDGLTQAYINEDDAAHYEESLASNRSAQEAARRNRS